MREEFFFFFFFFLGRVLFFPHFLLSYLASGLKDNNSVLLCKLIMASLKRSQPHLWLSELKVTASEPLCFCLDGEVSFIPLGCLLGF